MTLADLPAIVLGPLRGRPDEDWQRAPAGKWTPAQIVEHLALGIGWSAEKFQARRAHAPMAARPRTPAETIARLLILGLRWFPPGRKAPERSVPPDAPDRQAAESHFLAAIAAWEQLEKELLPRRAGDLYVKHPRLGDLSLEDWMRFHTIHARHHARQIRRRLSR
jgi:Protein of unknown function (DUF1569)